MHEVWKSYREICCAVVLFYYNWFVSILLHPNYSHFIVTSAYQLCHQYGLFPAALDFSKARVKVNIKVERRRTYLITHFPQHVTFYSFIKMINLSLRNLRATTRTTIRKNLYPRPFFYTTESDRIPNREASVNVLAQSEDSNEEFDLLIIGGGSVGTGLSMH